MISVIIPVYNAETYLNECVRSVLKQTYTDFELLLIDDGSPDHCPGMCDNWAKEDCRIRAIHKKNGGVSSARNAGIYEAKGEYLCFVDSDDTLPSDALQLLWSAIDNNGTDISVGSFQFQYGKKFLSHASRLKEGHYEFIDLMSGFIDDGTLGGFLLGSVCGGLYKRSLILENNLLFVEGLKNNEDGLFNFEYALHAKSLYVIDTVVYNYRQDNEQTKPNRKNENFGEKVFDNLNTKEWPKLKYDYEKQKSRRNVTLAWWEILHFANEYDFIKSVSFIRQILSRESVRRGMNYMCPGRMNRYKKIVFYLMKYRFHITLSILLRYVIPVMQKRVAR